MADLPGPVTLELLEVGVDDHCGCRVEEMLVNGIYLHVHYEDGSADAYLDWGDDGQEEFSAPAPTLRQGRAGVLTWARTWTQPIPGDLR